MINSYRVNYMNDDADPHVFIFVPYARAPSGTPNYGREFPVGLQEAFGQDDGLPSKTQQIENEVKAIFGSNVPYEKVVYAPRAWQDPQVPEDLMDSKLKRDPESSAAQEFRCQEKASWHVWFEGHELQDSHQAEWVSSANPVASNPQGAVQGRQDSTSSPIVCPLPSSMSSGSSSSTTQSASSISQSPSSTSQPPSSTSDPPPSTTSPSPTESSTTEITPIETSTESSTIDITPIETSTTTTTEPTPTPTTVITPLQVFDIVCNSEADFPGHGDVSPGAQDNFAVHFSGLDGPGGSEYMSSTTPTFEMKIADKHGISYDYSVGWVPGCVTTVDEQSFRYPLAVGDLNVVVGDPSKVTAYWLLRVVFTDCNNRGVGGKRQAGCLEYTFTGAK
ncbi:hypothetical protein CHU98_g11165 [Xylaria longipes]|nr:hypothetical protein CHU98_g11165 [Xylaria longipes]